MVMLTLHWGQVARFPTEPAGAFSACPQAGQ
jgi:hypothetical protein